jgi:hypothetical protein
MYHITERNERQSRKTAMWLAIALHLGLAAALYLQTGGKPAAPAAKAIEKQQVAKPRVVSNNIP